jgi:hypothetical protein
MQKIIMTEGRHATVALEGAILTVGNCAIDLAARQADVATAIDLSLSGDGSVVEGRGAGWYVANIVIPPATYTDTETGESGEDGSPVIERRLDPLKTDLVTLNLWALPTTATEGE